VSCPFDIQKMHIERDRVLFYVAVNVKFVDQWHIWPFCFHFALTFLTQNIMQLKPVYKRI